MISGLGFPLLIIPLPLTATTLLFTAGEDRLSASNVHCSFSKPPNPNPKLVRLKVEYFKKSLRVR
jgi:hypothetical protein